MTRLGGYTHSDFIDSSDCHPTIDEMSDEEMAEYLEDQEQFDKVKKYYTELDQAGNDPDYVAHEFDTIDRGEVIPRNLLNKRH